MSLDQALANFEKSLNRLAEAIENLRAPTITPATTITTEVPPPEKKPTAPKTKKNTGSESAAVAPASQPASNPPAPPAPPAASGPATVPPSAPPASSPGSFLDEDAPAIPPVITVEQLRAKAIECAGVQGEDWVKDVIRTVGNAPRISEIKPEKYAAVMAKFAEGMKG